MSEIKRMLREFNQQDSLMDAKQNLRNQLTATQKKLEAAEAVIEQAEKLQKEAIALINVHQMALSQDGGNSNMECLRLESAYFIEAIEAYRAGASDDV